MDKIQVFIIESNNDLIKRSLEQIIKYCRHIQEEYLKDKSDVSGVDILHELVQNNNFPLGDYFKIRELIENSELPYIINIKNKDMNITQEQPEENLKQEDALTTAIIEFNKCTENPYYFATKYLTINGRKFTTMLTESEFNDIHGFNITL